MEENQKISGVHGWACESEARKILMCRNTKLWQLRRKGLITFSKVGNRTFYKLDSIEKLLEKNAVEAK